MPGPQSRTQTTMVSSVRLSETSIFTARAAVFGGIVDDIEKDLLHAVPVARDKIAARLLAVMQGHLRAAQQVFIHINGFVKFKRKVKDFHFQRHAARFDAGEVQKFFDHLGQAAAFLLDDVQALHDFFRVLGAAGGQRFAPGRQWRSAGCAVRGDTEEIKSFFMRSARAISSDM